MYFIYQTDYLTTTLRKTQARTDNLEKDVDKFAAIVQKMESKLAQTEEEKKKISDELLSMKSQFIQLIEDEHMLN